MKPRNDIERQVVKTSHSLPDITETQKRYAEKHCFEHLALVNPNHPFDCLCLECGHQWQTDLLIHDGMEITCPHCGTKLTIKLSRRRTSVERNIKYFQIVTKRGNYQIVRTFFINQQTKPHYPSIYLYSEIAQMFININGDVIVLGKTVNCQTGYVNFCHDSELSIKERTDWYDIWGDVVYPRQNILPIFKRNGWCNEMKSLYPTSTLYLLLKDYRFEMIAKSKRFDLWENYKYYEFDNIWPQIKLAIKHHYHPSDYSMWNDTIRFTKELGLDTHSPKYILPNNLKEMHDTLDKKLKKRRKEEAKRRERERIAKIKEYERLYKKYNKKLLTIVIHVGDITIKPLQNYKEFCEEGDAMHHCVETYWKRKSSFILSARSGNDRLATIELDRKDFHVKQCRAKCNEVPERYDEIVNILNKNKKLFIRASK